MDPLPPKHVIPEFKVYLEFLPPLRLTATIVRGSFTGILNRLLLLSKFSSLPMP